MHIITVDYKTGALVNDFNTKQTGVLLTGDFSPDGKYLVTGQTGYFGEVNFDVILWDWETQQEICRFKGHYGAVKQVKYGPKSKRIYSISEDGLIKIWDIEKCQQAASLIGMNQMDYIILSPDNYYKTNKGNAKGVGFRYQENLYTFDQFDVRFNRPDKVLANLGISPYSLRVYTKAWEKRINRLGYTPAMLTTGLHLPTIEIKDRLQIPLSTEQSKIAITIKALDPVAKLDRLKIYVNDVPFPDAQGWPLKQVQNETLTKKVNIPLSKGVNLIKISALNQNGLESVRESFELEYKVSEEQKPDLYIFTIGVANFKDTSRNLQFAKKDGEDLVAMLKKTKRYEEVHVKALYNEDATPYNVKTATRFLQKAAIDDQVIVYVSTHGLLDDSLNYYLAMHTTNFSDPTTTGLPYEKLDELLDGLACRNRLVLVDACHSGEVDKSAAVTRHSVAGVDIQRRSKSGTTMIRPKAGLRNSFTYMQELFSNLSNTTGATVISAASGYEFALESSDWNNGVFTYAILQGLATRAVDLNKDGQVQISELQLYVTQKVIELTEGEQHPTTRTENDVNDFILYEY